MKKFMLFTVAFIFIIFSVVALLIFLPGSRADGHINVTFVDGVGDDVTEMDTRQLRVPLFYYTEDSGSFQFLQSRENQTRMLNDNAFTNPGHIFSHWECLATGEEFNPGNYAVHDERGFIPEGLTELDEGRVFIARWTAREFAITFSIGPWYLNPYNPANMDVTYGQELTASDFERPTRDGFIFGGWWTRTGGQGTRVDHATETVTFNSGLFPGGNLRDTLRVYAHWVRDPNWEAPFSFTLRFQANRENTSNPPDMNVTNNSDVDTQLYSFMDDEWVGWYHATQPSLILTSIGCVLTHIWRAGQPNQPITLRGRWDTSGTPGPCGNYPCTCDDQDTWTVSFIRNHNATDNTLIAAAGFTHTNGDQFPSQRVVPENRTNYDFLGYWTTRDGGVQYFNISGHRTTAASGDRHLDGNLRLYAQWIRQGTGTPCGNDPCTCDDAQTWTVTFFRNHTATDNNTVAGAGFTHTNGNQFPGTVATPPYRTGWTFTGYWTARTGGTMYFNDNGSRTPTAGGARTLTANMRLYARWTENEAQVQTWNVTFIRNHTATDNNIVAGAGFTHTNGTQFPTTRVLPPSRSGFTFNGYWTARSG